MLLRDVDKVRHLGVWCGSVVGKRVLILSRGLGCGMPGVVNGVRGQFISATEMIVGVNGLDVEREAWMLSRSQW